MDFYEERGNFDLYIISQISRKHEYGYYDWECEFLRDAVCLALNGHCKQAREKLLLVEKNIPSCVETAKNIISFVYLMFEDVNYHDECRRIEFKLINHDFN